MQYTDIKPLDHKSKELRKPNRVGISAVIKTGYLGQFAISTYKVTPLEVDKDLK